MRKWLIRIGVVLFLGCLMWTGYFGWKILNVSRRIQITSNVQTSSPLSDIGQLAVSFITEKHKSLKGETDGRINILLLGKAGSRYPGKHLTDTVMIMSLDTMKHSVGLLSLPRDLSVKIPGTGNFTKINSVYGLDAEQENEGSLVRETVEEITGLPLHYFFVIDFDGFEKVIDALGGIHLEVERDIYDPSFPGPHYSYQTFELSKGWQTLDGATALKYVRERHGREGDFGRAKRQQQVIQAVRNKVFSRETFLNAFALNDLISALGESIRTDIRPSEIESFIALGKHMDTQNITNVVVDAWKPESLLRVSHVMVGPARNASRSVAGGPTRMFILVPRSGNWREIQDVADHLFTLDALKEQQQKVESEEARIVILNRSDNEDLPGKVKKLLSTQLGTRAIEILPTASQLSLVQGEGDTVLDLSGHTKPFTLDALLRELPVTLEEETSSLPEAVSEADIILILGDQIAKALDFEEDSAEDFWEAQEHQDYWKTLPQVP